MSVGLLRLGSGVPAQSSDLQSEIPTFVERNSRNETGQSSLKPELLSQRDYLYLQ